MALTSKEFVMGQPLSSATNPHYMCYIIPLDRGMDPIIAHLPSEYLLNLGASYQAPFSQGPKDLHAHVGPAASAFGIQFANKAMTAQLWQGSNEMEFSLPLVLQLESNPNADILKPLSALYELVLPREDVAGGLLTSPGPHLDLDLLKQSVSELSDSAADAASQLWESFGTTETNPAKSTQMGDADLFSLSTAGEAIKNTANAGNSALAAASNAITAAIKYNIALMIGQFQFFPSVVITNVSQLTKVRPYWETGTMSRVEVTVTFRTFYTPTNRDLPSLLLGTEAQWNESNTSQTESTQRGNESNAVQQTPVNSTDSADRQGMADALSSDSSSDPVSFAYNRSAWG
jgi:hypothetical protein